MNAQDRGAEHSRERMQSEALRRRVREMLAAGYSVASIAKAVGKTYQHTSKIVAQERLSLNQEPRT